MHLQEWTIAHFSAGHDLHCLGIRSSWFALQEVSGMDRESRNQRRRSRFGNEAAGAAVNDRRPASASAAPSQRMRSRPPEAFEWLQVRLCPMTSCAPDSFNCAKITHTGDCTG